MNRTGDLARILLALIRLVNGLAALFTPGLLARRLGIDPETTPAALYVFRMFGIRTVLIAIDLLAGGSRRSSALRAAPMIHASDTLAALLAARAWNFPQDGRIIVGISALNTVLAVIARQAAAASRGAGRS